MVILISYENMYKMKSKSVYNRKYHINNLMIKLCELNYIKVHDNSKLMPIFKKIDRALHNINKIRE